MAHSWAPQFPDHRPNVRFWPFPAPRGESNAGLVLQCGNPATYGQKRTLAGKHGEEGHSSAITLHWSPGQ